MKYLGFQRKARCFTWHIIGTGYTYDEVGKKENEYI